MSDGVTIKGDKGLLQLRVLGYENNTTLDESDRNWLRVELEVSVRPFSGAMIIAMTTGEFQRLHDDLVEAIGSLDQPVRFSTMEGNLFINVTFERSGQAKVAGTITQNEAEGILLNYEFMTDPITLEKLAKDLKCLIEKFPAYILQAPKG